MFMQLTLRLIIRKNMLNGIHAMFGLVCDVRAELNMHFL